MSFDLNAIEFKEKKLTTVQWRLISNKTKTPIVLPLIFHDGFKASFRQRFLKKDYWDGAEANS